MRAPSSLVCGWTLLLLVRLPAKQHNIWKPRTIAFPLAHSFELRKISTFVLEEEKKKNIYEIIWSRYILKPWCDKSLKENSDVAQMGYSSILRTPWEHHLVFGEHRDMFFGLEHIKGEGVSGIRIIWDRIVEDVVPSSCVCQVRQAASFPFCFIPFPLWCL